MKGELDQTKPLACQVIDGPYGYRYGPVAFNPAWAAGRQPSVKPVREQFYISLEITQPSTILAPVRTPGSKRSPWVISKG